MTLPKVPIATIALRQLQLRRARPVPDHEARLRPWAALALRAGADPAQVSPDALAALEDYRKAGLTDGQARACLADDMCPLTLPSGSEAVGRTSVVATLATARDAALNALSPDASAAPASTSDLVVLAIHFGCPPYRSSPRACSAAARTLERAA